ncbi:MAG TPA: hypothetical protein VG944_18080 [Fimbriimonas sp.]|nr:hypothetical protein [Fimbriimonas sp.]
MFLQPLLVFTVATSWTPAKLEQLKYVVYQREKKEDDFEKAGTMTDETTGGDDDGYVEEYTLNYAKSKNTKHVILHYDKNGIESSKSIEIEDGETTVKFKATMDDDGAKVTAWVNDQKVEKTFPLATKTSRADPTDFWFKKVKPAVGDSVTVQEFDPEEGKWSDATLKFVGRKKIKMGDSEVELNEIDRHAADDDMVIFVDDKGDLVRMENVGGTFRIDRENP